MMLRLIKLLLAIELQNTVSIHFYSLRTSQKRTCVCVCKEFTRECKNLCALKFPGFTYASTWLSDNSQIVV